MLGECCSVWRHRSALMSSNLMRFMARGRAIMAALAVGVFLAGCGGAAPSGGETSGQNAATGEVPEFTGPWAGEFAAEYQRSESEFVRAVLRDGTITDQELAETRTKFSECLSAHGFTNIQFEQDGAFEFKAPESADQATVEEQVKSCSADSGEETLAALASWIRRNPENQDENTIMAACLVRKGAVGPAYSAEEYARSFETDVFPYLDPVTGPDALRACNADPLGLFE